MNLSIADLHQIVGGRLRLGEMPPRDGESSPIGAIVTDSRRIQAGDVFWGLPGARQDGAHFAEDALARGASGVVTSGRWVAPWAGHWSLEVQDASASLWRLAGWNCNRFSGRVVIIDGAVGKMTAGAMIAAVLNARLVGQTIADPTQTEPAAGVAEQLIRLRPHDDYALVEWNEGLQAQVSTLGRLVGPDIAVFIHSGAALAGDVHSTTVDSGVAQRLKSALAGGISTVVNYDDPNLGQIARDQENVVLVGRGLDANVAATKVECADGCLRFDVDGRRFNVQTWNRRDLAAALAAIAVGRVFGLNDAEIADGLASYESIAGHCHVSQTSDATIIDGRSAAGAKQAIAREHTTTQRRAA